MSFVYNKNESILIFLEEMTMGMIKRLAKTGTSYSVIIDRTMMKLLQITPETNLNLSIEGESLVITPVKEKTERQKKLELALSESFEQYDSAYKRLAE
jgi:antitoxin component of MazEF toxin-antitoxin module